MELKDISFSFCFLSNPEKKNQNPKQRTNDISTVTSLFITRDSDHKYHYVLPFPMRTSWLLNLIKTLKLWNVTFYSLNK